MVILLLWLYTASQLQGAVIWFAIGLFLSLLGDIFLMWADQLFIPGLVAFLTAHIFYIIGFLQPFPNYFKWEFAVFVVFIAFAARQVFLRLSVGFHDRNQNLRIPVLAYTVVISIMLLVASSTLVRLEWGFEAALLAAFGALSFYISDAILAWMKFVAPLKNGRVVNMITYHLGQFMIALAAYLQFGK
jgi:uncharacterized membrane protein YhhN